ncbi:cullin, putative, partial [Entamoeba invadens IP1]
MEVTKESVDELYYLLEPFIDIVTMRNEAPTTTCVLASMHDLVYTFFCDHYWDTEGIVLKMIQDIVSSFSKGRYEKFKAVSDDNLILALESEFIIWKRVRKCLKTTFMSVDNLVHCNYVNTMLNCAYRDTFMKQSQAETSKRIMGEISKWRLNGKRL